MFPNQSLANLLRQEGVTFMRFGGDMASTLGSWKHYRGPREHRQPRNNYGIAWYERYGGSSSWMYFEFIAMCEELGIIPVIGLAFDADTASVNDNADIIEYLYGSSHTPWGAMRIKDGHPTPYGSVWIQFGNEVGMSEQYADFVLNATAAMEQRSVGTPMERKLRFVSNVVLYPGDFQEPKLSAWKRLIKGAIPLGSRMLNDHHEADGQLLNLAIGGGQTVSNVVKNSLVLANFSQLLHEENSSMKLIVGELDAFSNPGACDHCQLRALQTAAYLNLYQSHSDLIEAICYVNAFERLQQEEQGSGWYQGQVLVLPNMTIREPPYYVLQMASEATQKNVVRSSWKGTNNTMATTADGVEQQLLQIFATASDDGKVVAVRVVNQGCEARTLRLVLRGHLHGTVRAAAVTRVNGSMLRSRVPPPPGGTCVGTEPAFGLMMREANTPARPESVVPEPVHASIASDGSVGVALPHWSFLTLMIQL